MRLLYLITRSEPGGAQVHLLELLRGLQNRAELYLGVGSEDGEAFLVEEARSLGVKVHLLPHLVQPLRPTADLRGLREVLTLIQQVQPNLVHAHSSKAGLLGRMGAWRVGVPSVFTAHGFAFTDGVTPLRKALALPPEWVAGRLGSFVIAVSENDHKLALRYRVVAPSRVTTIWNGIPDVPYRANPVQGPPKIVMVARFAPPKSQTQLLTALSGLRELSWSLELVGEGPLLEPVRRLAAELGISDRVSFLGVRRDVEVLLAQGQIFALASDWEGLPLSLLEAMRAGLPVIASNVGGVPEAVADGETGFLIPKGDVETLRDRLVRLIQDPELRMRMGAAGRARYEAHFTLEQMLEKTLAVYGKVLKRGVS